jgi:hypothetical protein
MVVADKIPLHIGKLERDSNIFDKWEQEEKRGIFLKFSRQVKVRHRFARLSNP